MGLSKDDYNKSVLGQMRKLGFDDNKPKVVLTIGEPGNVTSINTGFNCDSINLVEDSASLGIDSGWKNFFGIKGAIGKDIRVSTIGQYAPYSCPDYINLKYSSELPIFILASTITGKIDLEHYLLMDKTELSNYCESSKVRNDRRISSASMRSLLEHSSRIRWEMIGDVLLANNPETDTKKVLEIIKLTKGQNTPSPHIWLAERALGTKLEDEELIEEKKELIKTETGSPAIYRYDGYSRVYRILK